MQLSKTVDQLIKIFEEERPSIPAESGFTVSRTVSALASLYEKARNAVEFRAEHLVRRAAIERILKRRIMLGETGAQIAENLAIELVWAKYIDSSLINKEKGDAISSIINRYLHVKQTLFARGNKTNGLTWQIMLGLASSEIDETIISPKKRTALIDFVYQAMSPKITIPGADERKSMVQVYIGVERSFAQADNALIAYHLLLILYPEWFTVSDETIQPAIPTFIQTINYIQYNLNDPVNTGIARYIRRQLPAYRLLRDFFLEQKESEIRPTIENVTELENKLTSLANKRYQEIGAKVRRAVVRSIIYIFLTKMILALALEAPVDTFIEHRISYIPLIINLLFPPILLYLVAGFITIPGAANTKHLIEQVKNILFNFDSMIQTQARYSNKPINRRPILLAFFSLFYLIAFVLSFGFITIMLTKLHFNFASQIIFVFFVALVSIFAYRIRQSAKEYEVIEHQGFLEPLIDFFFLPILHAGDLLSKEIAKINFFIFLFDFVLEAPLKVIFSVVEEWIRFIRMKKEEII